MAEPIKHYVIQVNKEKEADIINELSYHKKKSEYVIGLIQKDIKNQNSKKI